MATEKMRLSRRNRQGDFAFTLKKVAVGETIQVGAAGLATKAFRLSFQSKKSQPQLTLNTLLVESDGLIAEPVQLGRGASVTGRLWAKEDRLQASRSAWNTWRASYC